MEACSTAHTLGRLPVNGNRSPADQPPQYLKTNKNDGNDAEAIVEAASRPTMRFVPVKSVEQQHIQAAHRMRAILLRTAADELPQFCRTLLTELLQHLRAIEERINFIEICVHSFMKQSALCRKIAQIPGIGPITAAAIVAAVGAAWQFRNGRHLAAGLGLVPRRYFCRRQVTPASHQPAR